MAAELTQEELNLIVEAAPSALLLIDSRGDIQYVNAEGERLFGCPRERLVGRSVHQLVPERIRHEHVEYAQGFMRSPQKRAMGAGRDLYALRGDSSEVPVEIGLTPIRDQGEIMILCTVVDISERKRAESTRDEHARAVEEKNAELSHAKEALERAVRELESRNRDLDDLAHVISHDLKAPLRAVSNLTEWISEDEGQRLSEEGQGHLTLLRQRVARMAQLLEDLLRYSRAVRAEAEWEWMSCTDLMAEVLGQLYVPDGFHIDVDVPDVRIHTERVPLEQVLRNLVENAIKHHDRCDGRLAIWSADPTDGWLRLAVKDDGPGIERDYHEQVFRAFQRLKSQDECEGTGLGLTLVKQLVEARGGRIEIASEGRGTEIRFSWPARKE